ncbi:MAG: type II toxin-antitoxin system VapC family toxin [Myxococcota bacterium]
MVAVDTNLLVYAHRAESPFHQRAAQRLRELAEGKAAWAIPWPCIHEFLAKVTHRRIFSPPSDLTAALGFVGALLESPTLSVLGEADGYWSELARLMREGQIVGPRVHDARIAAICLAHGVDELWTADRDFGRFPSLAVVNPLVA